MDTTTIRRRLRSRRTLCIALLGTMLLMLGTASVGSANFDTRGSKKIEWGPHKRHKRVGSATPTTLPPKVTTTTRPKETEIAPTTAPAPTTKATSTTRAAETVPTTAPAPTTKATSTTRAAESVPTTTRPEIVPGVRCGLLNAAFCETFDAPKGNGTRTGDLDPVLWGVSRVGDINPAQGIVNDIAAMSMAGCGTSALTFVPNDVRICNGQLFETMNDGGGVANLAMYPKQPFDFAGRTGRVVFDVSADSDGTHAAWPEFVITDKPVPGIRRSISDMSPPAAFHSVGLSLDGCTAAPGLSGVGTVFATKNGVYSELPFVSTGCVTKGSAQAMNHFEVRLSQSRLEVWGTDAGSSVLKLLAVADNLGLTFTRGLVWLNDAHYHARKAIEPCGCGTQFNHTFVWDNLGFDGPKTYRDLGFDVPDANVAGKPAPAGDATRSLGYRVGTDPVTLPVNGVRRDQTPTGALVVLNTYSFAQTIPSVSINGGPFIDTAWPSWGRTYLWMSMAIPVPLDQIRDGNNTLTFKSADWSTTVANVSIILVAGAPVP